jgi:predicted Zn-dependent protease
MSSRLQQLLDFHRKDPSDAFIRYGIALQYTSQQQYDEALSWFEDLRTGFPDYLPTYYMLGDLYRRLNRFSDARTVYGEGLQIARRANDTHTFSEISAALDELEDEE